MLLRTFLGYDRPFLPLLTAHLLADRESLAHSLVITPTSQSGRILRESLAASASALLAPTVTTPGALLHLADPAIAPAWIEKLAWIETLDSIPPADWQNFTGLFPIAPDTSGKSSDWAVSLASEIVGLRTTLQDHLHNLFSASKFLTKTPEADRWENLSRLETFAERQLSTWGYSSRSTALRSNFDLPPGFLKIILAGITEMPSCLAEAIAKYPGEVTVLIAAPESESEHFSPLGLPLESWATREIALPDNIRIAADPAQQAKFALEAISKSSAPSSAIALGSADDQTGTALAATLSEYGWPAFHPAAPQPLPALVRWLHAWMDWLGKASSANLAALLSLPESSNLIGGFRAQKLVSFNQHRDHNPTLNPSELIPLVGSGYTGLADATSKLIRLRESFLSAPFPDAIHTHLAALGLQGDASENLITSVSDFLETASPLFPRINRSHTFWLSTLLSELPTPNAQPPADRVIDIQGWLELLYEPGDHLVICGMNETFVPSRPGGEPWLSENIRKALGLNTDSHRHSRDAYLLHAMLKMREENGSAHLICAKNGTGGETYLPSRLLFQIPRETLVSSVKNLFREIEPPESNLIWTRDFQWQTPAAELPQRISVTALKDYLGCPFRFYLKHLVHMGVPEPDRREMNARDFGSITHLVLENFGKDPDARNLSSPEIITAYLEAELTRAIIERFGKKTPLAIRIQAQAILQRLSWFSHQQSLIRSDGWEIIDAERRFSIPSNNFNISGIIDRIDRHRETGQLRLIDYKTGDVKKIEAEHRQKITARTKITAHFPEGSPPFQNTFDAKNKPVSCFWKNLQLPIYSLSQSKDTPLTPIPAYIHLGKTEDNVKLTAWDDFSAEDLESAKSCASWVTASIAASTFWPPAEKVQYDDFALLSQNAPLKDAFTLPGVSSAQEI